MPDPTPTDPAPTPVVPAISSDLPLQGDGVPASLKNYGTLGDAAKAHAEMQTTLGKSQEELKATREELQRLKGTPSDPAPAPAEPAPDPNTPTPEQTQRFNAAMEHYYQHQSMPPEMVNQLAADRRSSPADVLDLAESKMGRRRAFGEKIRAVDEKADLAAIESWIKSGQSGYTPEEARMMEKWAQEGQTGFISDLVNRFATWRAGGGWFVDPATNKVVGAQPPTVSGRPAGATEAAGFKTHDEYVMAATEARGNVMQEEAVEAKLRMTPVALIRSWESGL